MYIIHIVYYIVVNSFPLCHRAPWNRGKLLTTISEPQCCSVFLRTPSCWKYSSQHQRRVNPPLKIVPNKLFFVPVWVMLAQNYRDLPSEKSPKTMINYIFVNQIKVIGIFLFSKHGTEGGKHNKKYCCC